MASNKIQENKDALNKIKHHLKWEELEVGGKYHIPRIMTINRMDIVVTSKGEDSLKFKLLNSTTDTTEKTMHKTSIFARFLVKKRRY
jgi:hypothetical protein